MALLVVAAQPKKILIFQFSNSATTIHPTQNVCARLQRNLSMYVREISAYLIYTHKPEIRGGNYNMATAGQVERFLKKPLTSWLVRELSGEKSA